MCGRAARRIFACMTLLTLARAAHIAAGMTALFTLPLPMFAKKGSALHRRAGWVYVVAMAVVAVTGAVMCAAFLTDADPRNDGPGAFLFFIAILSASAASQGVRALRTKDRRAPSRNAWDLGLPALLMASGGGVLALGVWRSTLLYAIFGAIGIVQALLQLRFWLHAPATRLESILEHVTAMGISSIATVTAFLVVNASRLGLSNWSLVLWLAPGVVGAMAIARARARLRAPRAPSVNRAIAPSR
jgi:uncharacterized membrane protein